MPEPSSVAPAPVSPWRLSPWRRRLARILWRCPWNRERTHLEELDAHLRRDVGLTRDQIRRGYDPHAVEPASWNWEIAAIRAGMVCR